MSHDNFVQSFQLERSNFRGRVLRLGAVLDDILSAHAYPEPVSHLLAEGIALSAILSSLMKYDGIFTLQAQGEGPVRMIVSDMTSENIVRGCAHFDADRIEIYVHDKSLTSIKKDFGNEFITLLGKGRIVFTVDQKGGTDRYQGVVELKGETLAECIRHYFTQSEQIATGIKLAVGQKDGRWRGGAIILQQMPGDELSRRGAHDDGHEDDWRRSMILLESCTEGELLDADLSANDLLFRLFHEEDPKVLERQTVTKGCRCSQERVENILYRMGKHDIDDLVHDGKVTVKCEFCSCEYHFDHQELLSKIQQLEQ